MEKKGREQNQVLPEQCKKTHVVGLRVLREFFITIIKCGTKALTTVEWDSEAKLFIISQGC